MIIFHQRQIITREERKRLLNRIINNIIFNIEDLQKFKTETLAYINYLNTEDTDLTPEQKTTKIIQLNWRISLLDTSIQENNYLLDRVSNQLQTMKYFTRSTTGKPVNMTSFNSEIYNIHHRFNLKFPTFAPYYPIRLQ